MTQGSRPSRPTSHQTGALAEHLFAGFATRFGCIWHPAASGADYGVDGRIEIVESGGSLSGVEFPVQVKGRTSTQSSRRGSVAIGRVQVNTARYWLGRLTPTLLVGVDTNTGAMHAEWVTRLPRLKRAVTERRTSVIRVRLPDEAALSPQRWVDICAEARSHHTRITQALGDDPLRQSFAMLYVQTASALDLLMDWMAMFAYFDVASWTVEPSTEEPDPETGLRAIAVQARDGSPFSGPPRLVNETGLRSVLEVVQAAATTIGAFGHALGAKIGPDHPLSTVPVQVYGTLRHWIGITVTGADHLRPDEDPAAGFYERDIDWDGLVTGVGLAALVLRDFNRDIRLMLFPWQSDVAITPRATKVGRVLAALREIPASLVTPAEEWTRRLARETSPHADEETKPMP